MIFKSVWYKWFDFAFYYKDIFVYFFYILPIVWEQVGMPYILMYEKAIIICVASLLQ